MLIWEWYGSAAARRASHSSSLGAHSWWDVQTTEAFSGGLWEWKA